MDLITMIDVLWIMTKIIIACWLMFKLIYHAKQGETTLLWPLVLSCISIL